MGIGIVVLAWLIIGIILVTPVVLFRFWRISKASHGIAGARRWKYLRALIYGVVAILGIGFWIPLLIVFTEMTDTDQSRFEMVFQNEPPDSVRIQKSTSDYSSDYTGAYVRFEVASDDLEAFLPESFRPTDMSDVPYGGNFPEAITCEEKELYQEVPWRGALFSASSRAALIYCSDTGIAYAYGVGID